MFQNVSDPGFLNDEKVGSRTAPYHAATLGAINECLVQRLAYQSTPVKKRNHDERKFSGQAFSEAAVQLLAPDGSKREVALQTLNECGQIPVCEVIRRRRKPLKKR
jgi:hypothetical protein